jgi:hypothetical protein
MPTQEKSPALFYGVAMAALLADGAGAIMLGQPVPGLFIAGILYIGSVALTGLWARLDRQNSDHQLSQFLCLATLLAGPFGAGLCFLAALVHDRCAPNALSPAEWIESLFERTAVRESDRLYERIIFGLDDFEAVSGVEPFADILSSGTVLQKQMAIAKIARYFRPAFAPLLLQSARDPNAAVRVQAATALAKIERDFMARYMRLETELKNVPDQDPAKLELAQLYDDYAHAGLLDEGNRNDLRQKAIGIYEACLKERDNTDWRVRLARLYLRQNQPDKTLVWLEPVVTMETPPRGAMLWYMEALFRMKKFDAVRHFSGRYAKKFGDLQPLGDTEDFLGLWHENAKAARMAEASS